MSLTSASVTTAVAAVTATAGYASLHTADPGTSGASEATGGSPAYARKAVTWTAGVTNQVTFDVGAGTYTHFGLWSAAIGGTFEGGNPLNASLVYSAQGTAKLTVTLAGTTS